MATRTTTSTVARGGRNQTILSPPARQRSLESMLTEGKSVIIPQEQQISMNSLQDTILKMQDNITKSLDGVKTEVSEVKNNMGKIEERVGAIQEVLRRNEQEIKEIKQRTEVTDQEMKVVKKRIEMTEKRTEDTENNLEAINKNLEEAIIHLEMEKAAFYLRIQNVEEARDENLRMLTAEILGLVLERPKEEITLELDEVYRINSSFARRHRLPREIHVKVMRRQLREDILNTIRGESITYKQKEILILKQIPRRVREKRRKYNFLSTQLNRHRIPFRWLLPEGLLATWREKRYKIDSHEKALEFHDLLLSNEERYSRDETVSRSQEEVMTEQQLEDRGKEAVRERDRIEERERHGNEETRPRTPIETRSKGALRADNNK